MERHEILDAMNELKLYGMRVLRGDQDQNARQSG
jgi:hypothetical protein